jgi:acyl-CoA synthetase (AMP-forming)/AMP-acid ligase II
MEFAMVAKREVHPFSVREPTPLKEDAMTIGSLFARHARYRPDHLAVVFGNQRLSYLAFNQSVNRLANAFLALGVAKGDKVATLIPNCLELLEVYWACAKIGAVVVPLSALLRPAAIANLVRDSDTVLLVTNSSFIDAVDSIKSELPLALGQYVLTDRAASGYRHYHALKLAVSDEEPHVEVHP